MPRRSDDDDDDYEGDDEPVKPRKKRKKLRPPIATPMRPLIWAILGLVCSCGGPLTALIGTLALNSAKAAEDELPDNSRADGARQMMFYCRIAGIIEICLGVIVTIVGIILKVTDKSR
jgi:hypothetical protein